MTGMSDEQLATIGYINVLWNGVERNLEGCIWAAANWSQELGQVVTADLQNVSRATLLMNIVHQRIGDDERLIEHACKSMELYERLRSVRNDLIHGFFNWSRRSGKTLDTLLKFTAKHRTGFAEAKVVPVSQGTLDRIAEDMAVCLEALNDLMHKLIFRQRYLDGERGPLARTYDDAVHGWRAPSFDTNLVRECLSRRSPPQGQPRNPRPPRSSPA